MKNITIAVDAMGGDHGPSIVVPAALSALKKHATLCLILVGDSEVLQKELQAHKKKFPYDNARLQIHHASEQVEMDESPSSALRNKKDSSMRVAINLVKENKAEACVSAGNTGALMATARFVLKTLPGIDRPAIISLFPTILPNKNMRMLDLGANVDSSAENLFQFAIMGSVLASALDGVQQPKIYLLNIGTEDIKGNEQVKSAALLLQQSTHVNYAGYIEGDEIFEGKADVVVCDGFVGNVALKTTEGSAMFITRLIKRAFNQNVLTRLTALIAMPVLKLLMKWLNPDAYNGASFIGLKGIVVKSHGGANAHAFACAIDQAVTQADKNIPQLISQQVEDFMKMSSQKDSEG